MAAIVPRAATFAERPVSWATRTYISQDVDALLSSLLLLMASAAVTAAATASVRNRWWPSRRLRHASTLAPIASVQPLHESFRRELAYEDIFSSRPGVDRTRSNRARALVALAVFIWALGQAALLFAQSPRAQSLLLSDALEHVVTAVPANLQPARAQEPCRRIEWSASDIDVTSTLVLQRCFDSTQASIELDDSATIISHIDQQPSFVTYTDDYKFGLIVAQTTSSAANSSSADTSQVRLLYQFQTHVLGDGLIASVRPEVDEAELAALFTAALANTSCPVLPAPVRSVKGDLTWYLAYSAETYGTKQVNAAITRTILHAVRDGVDLQVSSTQTDAGFGRTLARLISGGAPTGVTVGSIKVPRLNLMGCVIVGFTGIVLYLLLSSITDESALELMSSPYVHAYARAMEELPARRAAAKFPHAARMECEQHAQELAEIRD